LYLYANNFCSVQVDSLDNEGDAPEGTRLSSALCARLGVPEGTIWGLPAGQRHNAQPVAAPRAPQQSAAPAESAPCTPPAQPAAKTRQESYQARNLQEHPVSFDRSQPVSFSSAADSGISDEEKKSVVRSLQLQNEFDALNAKFLEAEKKVQNLEVQAKLDKETFDSATSALAEQVKDHKMAAEQANAKLAKALSATSTALSSTSAPGSSAFCFRCRLIVSVLCFIALIVTINYDQI
jgi:hypothetical protein